MDEEETYIRFITGLIELCEDNLSNIILDVLYRGFSSPMKPAQLLKEVNKISREKVSVEELSKAVERLVDLGLVAIIQDEKGNGEQKSVERRGEKR